MNNLSQMLAASMILGLANGEVDGPLPAKDYDIAERERKLLRRHFRQSIRWEGGKQVRCWRSVHDGTVFASASAAINSIGGTHK